MRPSPSGLALARTNGKAERRNRDLDTGDAREPSALPAAWGASDRSDLSVDGAVLDLAMGPARLQALGETYICARSGAPLLFLAGGTGVASFLAMLDQLA